MDVHCQWCYYFKQCSNLMPLQMNKQMEILPVRQSTKSIHKFKTLPIQQRVHIVSSELLGNSRYPSRPKVSRPSIVKPTRKTEDELQHRIKLLEKELQRKINCDGILRNFLKTMNTSEMSRIDIFLQLRKCEEIIEPLQMRLSQESQKSDKYVQKIQSLQNLLEEKEKKYIENMVVLQSQLDDNYKNHDKQIKKLKDSIATLRSQLDTNRILLGQFKKKNQTLIQQNKIIDKKYQKVMKQFETSKKQMEQTNHELQSKCEQISNEMRRLKSQNIQLKETKLLVQDSRGKLEDRCQSFFEELQLKIQQISNIKYDLQQKECQLMDLVRRLKQKQTLIVNLNVQLQNQTNSYHQNLRIYEEQNHDAKNKNEELRQLIKYYEQEKSKSEEFTKNDRNMIKELKEKQQTLIKYYQNQRAEMMIELKKEKFQDNQNESLKRKYQLLYSEKEDMIIKLQNKINDLQLSNESLSKRLDENQKDIDKYKAYEKISQKLSCEHYKTAGRLMEIKKQIMLALSIEYKVGEEQNSQQPLQKIVSTFAKAVYSLIIQSKNSFQRSQNMRKHFQQKIKQFCSILNHFKNAVQIENIETIIQKYITFIQSHQSEAKNSQPVNEVYHLIIQKLINAEKSKKFITQNSLNTVNDSLDNVIFKQVRRQSTQKTTHQKKYDQSIRTSNNHHTFIRSKQSDSNKENINTNEPRRLSKQKNSYSYNSIDKQIDYSTGARKSSGHIRSEIERKYFRS